MRISNIGDRQYLGEIDSFKFEAFFSPEASEGNLNNGRIRIFALWADGVKAPVLAIEGKKWRVKPEDAEVLEVAKQGIKECEEFIGGRK